MEVAERYMEYWLDTKIPTLALSVEILSAQADTAAPGQLMSIESGAARAPSADRSTTPQPAQPPRPPPRPATPLAAGSARVARMCILDPTLGLFPSLTQAGTETKGTAALPPKATGAKKGRGATKKDEGTASPGTSTARSDIRPEVAQEVSSPD